MINFELLLNAWPQLLSGGLLSLKIAFFSTLFGMVGGTLLALGQRNSFFLVRWFCDIYINIFRGVPMIVQIVFIYYGLNLPLSAINIAILAIGLNSSAYISQIIRSGISAIGAGQFEAAKVLGLSTMQTTRYIVLPQAIRTTLPALGNEFITLVKDSSLAYIIGVNELFKQSRNLMNATYDVATIYFGVAIMYLILTYTLSLALQALEKRWSRSC